MRIAITGASGNVGSAVLRALAPGGHEVVGIARRSPVSAGAPFRQVDWRSVDLTEDADVPALRDAVRGADAVVHLAWGFQPSHQLDHLEALGVDGTQRVADAVAAERVPHLVHMSSVGAYSPRRGPAPVGEGYPTQGVPTSPYSRHKAAAERVLDAFEDRQPEVLVTRLRPGIIGQRSAGSELLRYVLPGLLPAAVLRFVPVLPIDRRLEIPMVHADDVARALVTVLERQTPGAFNLAADPPITVDHVAAALGARHVQVPARAVRTVVAAAWKARVEQLDPGWIDLAYSVPLLDTARAERELDWHPRHTAVEVLEEVVTGMRTASHDSSPVLRRRRVRENLRRFVQDGPVHRRPTP